MHFWLEPEQAHISETERIANICCAHFKDAVPYPSGHATPELLRFRNR